MPDIKFDLSRVNYSSILEAVAPIVPGTILAFGTMILNPPLAAKLLSNPFLGYKSRIVAAILLSYISGLLLSLMIGYVTYTLGYLMGHFLFPKQFLYHPTPWRKPHWRRMARKFLGEDLAPSTDEPYFEDMHKAEIIKANEISDPDQKAAKLKFVNDFFLPRSQADNDWYWWYEILAKYFTVDQWWAPPWQYFISMVHSSSWAILLLMVLNHKHHWFVSLVCIIGIIYGNFGAGFSGAFADPYAITQTAMLLRIIKPHPSK